MTDVTEKLVTYAMDMLGLKHPQTREIIKVFLDYLRVFEQKHTDYGPGNILVFGELGCLVRASDKVQRLTNLRDGATSVSREDAQEDSWQDLMGYSAIAMVVRAGRWGTPEPQSPETPRDIMKGYTGPVVKGFERCPLCFSPETDCFCGARGWARTIEYGAEA